MQLRLISETVNAPLASDFWLLSMAIRRRILARPWRVYARLKSTEQAVQAEVSLPEKDPDGPTLKDFRTIAKEMREKSQKFRKDQSSSLFQREHRQPLDVSHVPLHYADLKKPVKFGDVILSGSRPMVILRLPLNFSEPYLACDASGTIHEVWNNSVLVKVGSLPIPPFDHELQAKSSVPIEIYQEVGYSLGALQVEASRLASKLLDCITNILLLLQRDETPVSLSIYDFMRFVQRFENADFDELPYLDVGDFVDEFIPQLTPSFVFGVLIAFNHYQLVNKMRVDYSNLVITIFSKDVERRMVNMTKRLTTKFRPVKMPNEFVDYVRDYGLGNLSTTNPLSEGIALQILRAQKEYGELNRGYGLAFAEKYGRLNLEGPAQDRYVYQFLKPVPDMSVGKDRLASIRKLVRETVYCIDSEDTTEVDDGISFRIKKGILTVGVHIANPSSALDSEEVVKNIFKKPTSAYFPHKKIPMLPSSVSDNFSLGKNSPALTIFMDFDRESGKKLNARIQASTLSTVRRLTYEQAESLPKLAPLMELAQILKKNRLGDSSIPPTMWRDRPQPKVIDGEVKLYYQQSTPKATDLVTELMIQANSSAAEYAWVHNIPCIYRHQALNFLNKEQEKEFYEQEEIGNEWFDSLTAATQGVEPARHASLGISMYTWFTSPLRRAQDMLLHMQFDAHLKGKSPPLSRVKLSNMIPWVSASQRLAKQCQRELERYQLLRYLEQHNPQSVSGIYWYTTDDTHKVYLEEYGLLADCLDPKPPQKKSTFTISMLSSVYDRITVTETSEDMERDWQEVSPKDDEETIKEVA